MKLDTKDVVLLQRRSIWTRVGRSCAGRIANRREIAMCEVHVGFRSDPLKHPRGLRKIERVPAHVRNARLGGKALHGTRENPQTGHFGCFGTTFKQRLKSKADTEKWNAGS